MKRQSRSADSGKSPLGPNENGGDELLFEWIRKTTPQDANQAIREKAVKPNDAKPVPEVEMNTQTHLSPHVDGSGTKIAEQFEDLKTRFRRIEQLAAEGQELLSVLSPRLEELSSMVADVDAVIRRWKREP